MRHKIRFGLDPCPATKNMTHPVHCQNCDFRAGDRNDCCECKYSSLLAPGNRSKKH